MNRTRGLPPFAETAVGQAFVDGVQGNLQTFAVNTKLNPGDSYKTKLGLLRMIYYGDFKKIQVVDGRSQIIISKNNDVLMSYDDEIKEKGLESGQKSVSGTIYKSSQLYYNSKLLHYFINTFSAQNS